MRDLLNLREIKNSSVRKFTQISLISTDFQNINDVWISGICVGKSENAAENTAFVFSLTEICRLNGINPETYLEKLFKCIVSKDTYDKRQLLPFYIKI